MNFRTLLHISKRAAASAVVALAFLMATQTAQAQDDRKQEVMLDAPAPLTDQPRKTLGKEAKAAPINFLVLEKQAESRKKLDAQIVRLKELLKLTRKGNPKRAEILFNLSEAYWEKSKAYNQEAYAKQDECYNLRDAGDEAGAKRCDQTMDDMNNESNRLRQESVSLYVEIVRDYPDFDQLDSVLYYLAANLQEIGRKDESLEMFKRLAMQFPKSKYIPNVLLAFGDYYFDQGQMDEALKAYKKVEGYPQSPVYAYALYKEAWCYFNLDKKDQALDTFLQVLKIAKDEKSSSTAAGLVKQTRKDIVMTYSFVGEPKRAIPFFKKITTGDEWLKLAERLAVLYSDKGKPAESSAMYDALISANRDSWKVVDYQYEIVRNAMIGETYSEDVVKKIVQLLLAVQKADKGGFKDMDEAEYKKVRTKVEEFVRNNAALYHREAQKTKNDNYYGMAYVLYQYYLQTFPNGPETYTMTFFYAELLYRVQKWKEAAEWYEKTLALEPEGKYTNEAVHGLVLAYFKLVQIDDKTKDLSQTANSMMQAAMDRNENKDKKKQESAIPQPKKLSDTVQKLIHACELYAKLNPDGKEIVDVKYTMAREYYDNNIFDKAIPLFKDIAYSYPTNPLAIISANLQLDSLNLIHDYDGLEKAIDGYLDDGPIKDEEFLEQLREMGSSVKFMKCTVFDEKEKWKDAAQCYISFFRTYNQSDNIDKALYNAALDFERMKDLGKAIKTRLKLVEARPNSDLVQKSRYNIAANYHALAVYSEASTYYEQYADKYPRSAEAKDALANASTFRQGLGEYPKAIADYKKYLKLYGKDDPGKAADVYFQIGKILELQKDDKSAVEQYKRYIKSYGKKGTADQLLEANTKLGLYDWDQEGWKFRMKALKQFKKTIDIYDKLPAKVKDSLTTGADAVSQAQFMIAEDAYQNMARMKLDAKNEKELRKKFQEKNEAALKTKALFEKVLDFHRPDWSIAALYRIGSAYENFANAMRKSTVPKRLTYDQKEIYRGILEDYASQIESNAITAYQKALDVAKKASWFNDYSEKAEKAMSQLRPQDYRTPSEKRSRPVHTAIGLNRAKYIKEIEDEDHLADIDVNEEEAAKKADEETEKDTEADGDNDQQSADDSSSDDDE